MGAHTVAPGMTDGLNDDTYYKRTAVKGHIDAEVSAPAMLTSEELDDIIEILYFRDRDVFVTASRHLDRGALHLIYEESPTMGECVQAAIQAAEEHDLPLLDTVYTYVPDDTPEAPGEDRIPSPWDE